MKKMVMSWLVYCFGVRIAQNGEGIKSFGMKKHLVRNQSRLGVGEIEMKHKIEFDEICKSCKGTGLYMGLGERDGAAVVCHTCKGTGCHHFVYEYEDFNSRLPNKKAKWVLQTNPGIGVGRGGDFKFSDFGGMSYEDWKKGKKFQIGMEMRRFTCPAWWYQSIDYDKKPDWKECHSSWGYTFSECDHFKSKDKCWERWNKEYK